MTEPEESPAKLLLRAVDSLPKAERDRVLVWLLDPAPRSARSAWALRSYAQGLASRVPELSPRVSEALQQRYAGARAEGLQTVPMRLEASQHAALRHWCRQHGFSMATVLRGLVARFLDEQAAGGGQEHDN